MGGGARQPGQDATGGGTARGGWCEIYVLGELMERPMHGYLLQQILDRILGPGRQLSWGALYPLLRRLQTAGLITRETDGAGTDQRRKVYRITDAGRGALRARLGASGPYTCQASSLFDVKLANFGQLTPQARLEILADALGQVEASAEHLVTRRAEVAAKPEIGHGERPWVLRMIDHRLRLLEAERDWLAEEIRRLQNPAP